MSKLIAGLCCLMLAAAPLAMAQDKARKEPTEKQKAHQQKMKDCSKQAGDKKLKGNERKKFMKDCLSK